MPNPGKLLFLPADAGELQIGPAGDRDRSETVDAPRNCRTRTSWRFVFAMSANNGHACSSSSDSLPRRGFWLCASVCMCGTRRVVRNPFFETHLPRLPDSTDDLYERGQRSLVHPRWRGWIIESRDWGEVDESCKGSQDEFPNFRVGSKRSSPMTRVAPFSQQYQGRARYISRES